MVCRSKSQLSGFAIVLSIIALSVCVTVGSAKRLAIRSFQTVDGLPNNTVKKVLQDEKGDLWIATAEGLGRYDGYGFTNYGIDDGLDQTYINDVILDRKGRLWAATNGGGISMLIDDSPKDEPRPRKKFVTYRILDGDQNTPSNAVNKILFDTDGRL